MIDLWAYILADRAKWISFLKTRKRTGSAWRITKIERHLRIRQSLIKSKYYIIVTHAYFDNSPKKSSLPHHCTGVAELYISLSRNYDNDLYVGDPAKAQRAHLYTRRYPCILYLPLNCLAFRRVSFRPVRLISRKFRRSSTGRNSFTVHNYA